MDVHDRSGDRPRLRRADLRGVARAARRGTRPPGDPGAVDAHALGVRAHPAATRRAGARLLRDHRDQRPGDDPDHRLPGGGAGHGRRRDPAGHLRHRRLLPRVPGVEGAAPAVAAARRAAAAPHVPVRAADDAGGAHALLAQLHRPDHHRPPRRAGRGGAVRARGQVRERAAGARPRASSSPSRRSPTRSATTTRLAAPTRCSSPGSRPCWRSPSSDCGCWRDGWCGCLRPTSSSPPTRRSGPLAAGIALYAIYLAMVVVLGPHRAYRVRAAATVAAVVVNIGLNLWLVPEEGIVGAAIALVASYVVVLVLMYVFSQRLFQVPYEWRRLALLVGGRRRADRRSARRCVPTDGFDGFAGATGAVARVPGVALACGFLSPEERSRSGGGWSPGRSVHASPSCAALRRPLRTTTRTELARGAPSPETFEQAQRDSDRL